MNETCTAATPPPTGTVNIISFIANIVFDSQPGLSFLCRSEHFPNLRRNLRMTRDLAGANMATTSAQPRLAFQNLGRDLSNCCSLLATRGQEKGERLIKPCWRGGVKGNTV